MDLNITSPTFGLYGKTFTPSIPLCRYNMIKQNAHDNSDKKGLFFSENYKKFYDIESVLKGAGELYTDAMNSVVESYIEILYKHDIFDFGAEQFIKYHMANHSKLITFPDVLESVSDQYEAIIENEAEKDAYRTSRREGRGRVVGGGFGFEGAVKGMAQAGALNAASGALHGTVNIIGKGISMAGAAIKKSAMFNDPKLEESLCAAVEDDVYYLSFTFANIIEKKGLPIFSANDAATRKAEYMLKQLNMDTPKEDRINL